MLLKVIFSVLLICICKVVPAQFVIQYNHTEINYTTANISYAFSYITTFTDSALYSIPKQSWKPLYNTKIPISYVGYTTWLSIDMDAMKKYGVVDFVELNNPHINYLKCWIVKDDSIIKSYTVTGDNTPFNTRQIPTTSFLFPLNNERYAGCKIVFALDKRFTKLDIPIVFCSQAYYIKQRNEYSLVFGITMGFCMLLFILNIYLFTSLRKSFYAWYSLYLFLIVVYVCANSGFFFEYFTPNYPIINDALRPAIFCFIELPMLLFFIDLLDIKTKYPKLYSFNIIIVLLYFFAFVIAILSLSGGGYERQGFLLKLSSFVVLPFMLFALIQSIYFVVKKIPFSIFAVLSFFSFSFFLFVYSWNQKELIATNFFTKHANYLAIFSEAFLATFLLVWQYKYYRDQALHLQQQNINIQQEIFNETAAWQEKEMQRVSSLLHDTVGANLGFLRLEIDNLALNDAAKKNITQHIARIGNEVRTMSHSFSPIILQDKGLYNAINDTVKLINTNSSIDLQFEWLGNKDNLGLQYQIIIYRIIQELLQNILKHAKASNAFLQVLIEEKLISIYVEDDGVGMGLNEENKGVGLKSIENLVQLLKGSCRIMSSEEEGFNISIEFNKIEHEKI